MLDFTPKPGAPWSDNLEAIVDAAMQAENAAHPPRKYLGASRVGEECLRKLAYEFHGTPKDPGREFQGKTLRIFDMGHDGETRVASYLRLAGFTILTERPDGQQFGFAVAWSDERQAYTFAGHCDGVITAAPYAAGLTCPSLWENKALGEKSFNDVVRKGVKVSKPVYYAQMQLYMAYLDLAEHPGLFTALNRNTGALYSERVPFVKEDAQKASDAGVKVVSTRAPEEMPRIARERTFFGCKWCDFQDTCWSAGEAAPAGPAPTWLSGQ